jgi:hypothetical protein
LKYDYFKIDGLKSNLYLQYVVSQNNFQDKFVIGWNDLMYYKLVGVNELGFLDCDVGLQQDGYRVEI